MIFTMKENVKILTSIILLLTTATRNAALRFPQAAQHALLVRKGNHLLRQLLDRSITKSIS